LNKYVKSILTTYVVKSPPDHEAALALLLRLRGSEIFTALRNFCLWLNQISESEPHMVEDAVKYIIFLVDADTLFDTALGMYDFSLVLMIAQHAQKVWDPYQ
jgi:elongator complex protein 1